MDVLPSSCGAIFETKSRTALHYAAFYGRVDIVKDLLEKGASKLSTTYVTPNFRGEGSFCNPLHLEPQSFVTQWSLMTTKKMVLHAQISVVVFLYKTHIERMALKS